MSNINPDPYVIGYWARFHDLTWTQVIEEGGEVAEALNAFDGQPGDVSAGEQFKEGWDACDLELQGERMQALVQSLVDVNGITAPARDDQKARRRMLTKRPR